MIPDFGATQRTKKPAVTSGGPEHKKEFRPVLTNNSIAASRRTREGNGEAPHHHAQSEIAQAERWFQDQVSRARKVGKFGIWATLTPALAEALIRSHMPAGTNRLLRERHVADLARIMQAGEWDGNSHQGISFAPDGVMNDGQHRTHAVLRSGCSIEVMMAFGQPREAFEVIDQVHRARTAGDLVHMSGVDVSNNNIAAAAARGVLIATSGRWSDARNSITRTQILDFVRDHEADVAAAVKAATRIAYGVRAKLSGSTLAGGLFLILAQKPDKDAFGQFVEMLTSGAALAKGSPVLTLREGMRTRAFGTHLRNSEDRKPFEMAAIIKAWNLWRAGRSVQTARGLAVQANQMPKAVP